MTNDDDRAEICTFVVRVWLEEDGEDGWRGHITHVLSDVRQHFETVETMDEFILEHVRQMQGPTAQMNSAHAAKGTVEPRGDVDTRNS